MSKIFPYSLVSQIKLQTKDVEEKERTESHGQREKERNRMERVEGEWSERDREEGRGDTSFMCFEGWKQLIFLLQSIAENTADIP